MLVPSILLSVSFIFVSWFSYEKCKAYSIKAVIIKSICSLLFIALAAYSFSQNGYHKFSIAAIIALVFGMIGDIALELKCVYKNNDHKYTYIGFVAFALGHVAYITGLFLELYNDQVVLYFLLPVVFAILVALICVLIEKPLKLNYGEYRLIVFLYALALFFDLGISFSFAIMTSFKYIPLILIFVGMSLFALSDLILNITYFGEGHEKPIDLVSNTFIYYIAQNLIALSILFL